MNSNRYARQTTLSEIGLDGQSRLTNSRILCIGMGGLGSPASLYLAAAGVGTIGLMDADRVDKSNLQRQILFQDSDQGLDKTFAAKNRLSQLNPEINIVPINNFFDFQNALSILANYDVVIDGSDNFETKFLINDACYKAGIPMVYGAVNRFEGQVAFFHGMHGPCYRCLQPIAPKALVRNCAETGVLGSIVGTIGTLQATLAIQYLISGGDCNHPLFPNYGELTLFDLRGKWSIHSVQIPKNLQCPTCSYPSDDTVLPSAPQTCTSTQTIDANTVASVASHTLILDVREKEEWTTGHIAGATLWPLSRLEMGEFPPRQKEWATIIVYCQSGQRSRRAVQLLSAAGIHSAKSLTGGIESWPEKLVF